MKLSGIIDRLGSEGDQDESEWPPEICTIETLEGLFEELLQVAYVDGRRAGRIALAAERLAGILGTDYALALALRCKGHVLLARAEYAEALGAYQEAVRMLSASHREVDLGRTLATGLQTLIFLSRYEEAFEWAERAERIFRRHGDHLRLARLASNKGNILFRLDRHQEAIALYEESHEILNRVGEPRDIAASLNNLAVCYTSLGDFTKALDNYEKARSCSETNGLDLLVAEADYNIAYLHYLRGDYMRAMELYRQTRVHCARAGDPYHAALCDLDESEMFLDLNLSEEGFRLAQEASISFERLQMGYERAKAVCNMAIAKGHSGDTARAMALFRRAKRLFKLESNPVWPEVINLYLGILYHREGQIAEAWRYCNKASLHLSRALMPSKAALCDLLRAQMWRESGKPSRARKICRAAREYLQETGNRSLLFHATFLLGQIEEDLGNRNTAFRLYQTAREEIEYLSNRLQGEEMRVSFLKDKLAVYESLVWLGLDRPSPRVGEILHIIEEAKSRRLAEAISLVPPGQTGHQVRQDLASPIQDLRKDLGWLYKQIDETAARNLPNTVARAAELRAASRDKEDQLTLALSRLRALDTESSVLLGAGTVSVAEIQNSIPEDAILLEYFEARGFFHACLITSGAVEIVRLGLSSRSLEICRLLQFQMTKFRLDPAYGGRFEKSWRMVAERHLQDLYDQLIAPVRERLTKPHLIIAPHRFLHQLPFHALHDGTRFLVDDFSVSYIPSASIFHLCSQRTGQFHDASLIVGVPDPRTPFIEEEARAVAKLLPNPRLCLGGDATDSVIREFGPVSRFIHIAAHGLFRADNPMFSSLLLGDSYLSLFDLYTLPLSAELVSLSGCSTGLNVVVGGDEIFGLMRGLFAAGTQSVLVSLWDVNDPSTAELMRAFYSHLRLTRDKSKALRSAMLETRERHPHPYYWAPFILAGNYMNQSRLKIP